MVASSSSEVNDEIVDYLEVKQQLLLSYCINVTFYLYMKVRIRSRGPSELLEMQILKAYPMMYLIACIRLKGTA